MWRDLQTLARPFWTSEERFIARGTTFLLIVLTLALVGDSVILNQLNGSIFDAIQAYQIRTFFIALGKWTIVALIYCFIYVYQIYVRWSLCIRWRRWMTDYFVKRWMHNKTFYYWQVAGQPTDNPDQRIAEDIWNYIGSVVSLSVSLLQNLATLISFVVILWSLGGVLHLWHNRIAIPGYLVWGSLLYATVGSFLLAKVGHPIIALNFNQQRYEADFRFSLVRLRENGEGIALSNGEAAEQTTLMNYFKEIVLNYRAILQRNKKINGFSIGYSQLANVFPLFLVSPRYFAHQMTLGGLSRTTDAFSYVLGSVSFFVNNYFAIAELRAVMQRLSGFLRAAEAAQELAAKPSISRPSTGRDGAVTVQDLTLSLPDGQTLFSKMNLDMQPGRATLINGPSGSGKSTLLRAIAGIWPYVQGDIRQPEDFQPMILPQRPYMPIGTLRTALAYPSEATTYSDEAIRTTLKRVRLPDLAGRLDESQNWALLLSPGEQQRVALARAFLQQPRWLFLDEATSALDEATEAVLYQEIAEALPNATVVSIGHRSTLQSLHEISHALTVETSSVPTPG